MLDEPTVGLDPIARDGVWDRVRAMRAEHGMTVLLTTHYMEEADELCDTVALMHRGRLAAAGSPAQLQGRPRAGRDAGRRLPPPRRRRPRRFSGKEGIRDVRRSRATARKLG